MPDKMNNKNVIKGIIAIILFCVVFMILKAVIMDPILNKKMAAKQAEIDRVTAANSASEDMNSSGDNSAATYVEAVKISNLDIFQDNPFPDYAEAMFKKAMYDYLSHYTADKSWDVEIEKDTYYESSTTKSFYATVGNYNDAKIRCIFDISKHEFTLKSDEIEAMNSNLDVTSAN